MKSRPTNLADSPVNDDIIWVSGTGEQTIKSISLLLAKTLQNS